MTNLDLVFDNMIILHFDPMKHKFITIPGLKSRNVSESHSLDMKLSLLTTILCFPCNLVFSLGEHLSSGYIISIDSINNSLVL